uniref:Platelet endothelial aggregation receptor 1-like protein isoform x2 n=1 Tax=Triatoma infestans TaxID=30076 RepID=A0A170VRS2_TRIIF
MAIKYLLLSGMLFCFSCAAGQVIGGRCRYDSDCFVEQSYCLRQERCECKENFLPTSDSLYCVATVGAVCNSRHDWVLR